MWPFSKKDNRIPIRRADMLPKEVSFGKDWVPQAVYGGVVQLYSKYVCLPEKTFNDGGGETTWRNCSLRKWLNSECYQELFSSAERNAIVSTAQVNAINTISKAVPGYTLDDRIIIPSLGQMRPFLTISSGWREDPFAFLLWEDSPCYASYWLRPEDEFPSRYGSIMDGDPLIAESPNPEKRGALIADNANKCGDFYTVTLATPSHRLPLDICPRVSEWREVRMIVHVDLPYLLSTIR